MIHVACEPQQPDTDSSAELAEPVRLAAEIPRCCSSSLRNPLCCLVSCLQKPLGPPVEGCPASALLAKLGFLVVLESC